MKKSVYSVTLIAALFCTSVLAAQDAALIQAARKEGKVVWYTSLAIPSSTAIAHYFQNKFKGIEVEVHRSGSQRVLQRTMQESTAGIKNGDIIHTSDAGHFELLKDKGLLLKFTPAAVTAFPEGFKDKAGFYYGMRATLSVIAYNPKIVMEKDAPKTWKDLLNNRWSGKLVTAHPGYSGIIMTHVLALVNAYGWDYFRDLAKNKVHITQSANDPAGVVASGERPIGVNGAEYFYYKTQKQGNPIKIVYPKEGRFADGHRQRRASSQCGETLHRVHVLQRIAAALGRQGRSLHRAPGGDLSERQAQAQGIEAAAGGRRRAGKAQRRDQKTLHRIFWRLVFYVGAPTTKSVSTIVNSVLKFVMPAQTAASRLGELHGEARGKTGFRLWPE